MLINNKENTKCKHCKNCKTYEVCRKNKNGDVVVEYKYCQGLKEFHDHSEWLIRGQGEYVSSTIQFSTNSAPAKFQYLHRGCIADPSNQLDHINHDKTDNRLCNLYECTQLENNQNHNNGNTIFHNVRVNRGKHKTTYTAFKKIDDKYITIGTFNTDIEAYGAFVDFCRDHNIKINPHTSAFKIYESVKSTNSIFNSGVHIIGGYKKW